MYRVIAFTSSQTSQKIIRETLLAHPDQFRLYGQFSSAIDAQEFASMLKPDIILLSDLMLFLDVQTFIRSLARQGFRVSYILLTNLPGSQTLLNSFNQVEAAVPESELSSESLWNTLSGTYLQNPPQLPISEILLETTRPPQTETLPWLANSTVFAELINNPDSFQDFDNPVFNSRMGYLLIGMKSLEPNQPFSFILSVRETSLFLERAQMFLDSFGKGRFFIIQENKLGIWLSPPFPLYNEHQFFDEFCRGFNELFVSAFHVPITFQRSDEFLSIRDLPRNYRAVDSLCSYRFFVADSVILSSGWLTEHSESVTEESIQEQLHMLDTALFSAYPEDVLHAVGQLFQSVRSSLSRNTYAHVWNLMMILYTSRAQQFHLPKDRFSPLFGHTSFNRLTDAADAMQKLFTDLQDALRDSDSGPKNSYISQAAAYLNSHISAQTDLETVAEHVHVSAPYLSQLFRKELGKTFREYRTELRIEYAKQLLQKDYKIYEIASMTGFQNEKYFSSTFRKVTGFSPRQYRKRCQEEPQ